jgi:hypothetical protein
MDASTGWQRKLMIAASSPVSSTEIEPYRMSNSYRSQA